LEESIKDDDDDDKRLRSAVTDAVKKKNKRIRKFVFLKIVSFQFLAKYLQAGIVKSLNDISPYPHS
jgi:hypothetical protein